MSTKHKLDKDIARGKEPIISPSMSRYINLNIEKDGSMTTTYKFDNWQTDVGTKGF